MPPGHHRRVSNVCQFCGKTYMARQCEVKQGRARACSRSCRSHLTAKIIAKKKRAEAKARIGEPYEIDGALVCEVRLSSKGSALIDAEDAELVGGYLWRWHQGGHASTRIWDGYGMQHLYMHRLIMNPPADREVDHRNGNGLDNRKRNLRIVTHAENMQNLCGVPPKSSTGVRGVSFRPGRRFPFTARVEIKGVQHRIGSFETLEEADRAARDARRRYMTHSAECHEPETTDSFKTGSPESRTVS